MQPRRQVVGVVAGTPFTLGDGSQIAVTVSIGVASLGAYDPDRTIEAVAQHLIADADAALYRAKDGGRNQVVSA